MEFHLYYVKTAYLATTSQLSVKPKPSKSKTKPMKSLGQIAYEADATKLGWKSPFTGQTLKEWDTLKIMNPIVAEAWECAAMMVADRPHLNIGPEQTQINTNKHDCLARIWHSDRGTPEL
jgi:hypothetical protein